MLNNAQTLNFGKLVELLFIDLANAPGAPSGWLTPILLSNSAVSYNTGPVWRLQTYKPANFELSGINIQANGQMPEPTLQIQCEAPTANNLLGFMMTPGASILGARVSRYIINADHLDNGKSPSSDPNDFILQRFFIVQKSDQLRHSVTFKLSPAMGLDRLNDNINRSLSTTQCNKKYRVWNIAKAGFDYVPVADGGCEWGQTGEQTNFPYCSSWGTPYFDQSDNQVTDPAKDRCSLSVVGCKKRFPITDNSQPFPISINLNASSPSTGS